MICVEFYIYIYIYIYVSIYLPWRTYVPYYIDTVSRFKRKTSRYDNSNQTWHNTTHPHHCFVRHNHIVCPMRDTYNSFRSCHRQHIDNNYYCLGAWLLWMDTSTLDPSTQDDSHSPSPSWMSFPGELHPPPPTLGRNSEYK